MSDEIKCTSCGNTDNVFYTDYYTVAKKGRYIRCYNKGCKDEIKPDKLKLEKGI